MKTGGLEGLDSALSRRRVAVLCALTFLAVLLRILYFVDLQGGPFADQHRWVNSDMSFFDSWARTIAGGDWLTDRALHPIHDWHEEIAGLHFAAHPGDLDRFVEQATADTPPQQLLWNGWYGEKQFHQEPLYSYAIALGYRLIAEDVRVVFALQMLLGIGNLLLIWWAARRFFGDTAALVAGAIALLYGPLLFYELVLLRPVVITFVALSLLFCITRAAAGGRRRWWLITGLGLGVALLTKTSFALLPAGMLLALPLFRPAPPRRLVVGAAAVLAGVGIALAPLVARNLAVGAPAFSASSVGAVTYVNSNLPEYRGDDGFHPFTESSARILAETGGRFLPAVAATLRMHSPASFLRLLWRKTSKLWHGYEHPNNANFYFYREHLAALRITFVPFSIVGPLIIVGGILGLRRLRELWPLYLVGLSLAAPLLVFYTLCRFRVPMTAAAIPFAAFAVVRLAGLLVSRRRGAVAAGTVALVALAAWASRPLPQDVPRIRFADYIQPYNLHFYYRSLEAERNGDWDAMRAALEQTLEFAPPFIHESEGAFDRSDPEHRRLGEWHARIFRDLSRACFRVGDTRQALVHARWAVELDPQNLDGVYDMARELQGRGAFASSLDFVDVLERVAPRYRNTQFLKGFALQMEGDLEGAIETYGGFVDERPSHYQGAFNLAHALMTSGRCAEAKPHFERALALKPDYAEIHLHLARCFDALGRSAEAAEERRRFEGGS